MLYFSRWKATRDSAHDVDGLPLRDSEFLPEKTVQSWPKWAQRHLVLGLDLQGGSHILLEVDTDAVRKEKLDTLRDDVRRVVRDNRLGGPAAVTIRGSSVEFRVREGVDPQLALTKLRELSQPLGGLLSATGQRTWMWSTAATACSGSRRPSPRSSSESARRSSSRSRSSRNASTSSAPSSRRSSARASTVFWCRCRACRIRRV